jgi:hypothetical protein
MSRGSIQREVEQSGTRLALESGSGAAAHPMRLFFSSSHFFS